MVLICGLLTVLATTSVTKIYAQQPVPIGMGRLVASIFSESVRARAQSLQVPDYAMAIYVNRNTSMDDGVWVVGATPYLYRSPKWQGDVHEQVLLNYAVLKNAEDASQWFRTHGVRYLVLPKNPIVLNRSLPLLRDQAALKQGQVLWHLSFETPDYALYDIGIK